MSLLRKIEHIPNAITISRVALVPVLILLLQQRDYRHALIVFTAAGLSDALDGFIAKRYRLQTQLGAILDPLADKILLVSAYVVLPMLGQLPFWLGVVVVFRDLLIVGGYLAYTSVSGSVQMRPSLISKANTALQIILVVVVLARAATPWPLSGLIRYLVPAVLASTIASGVHYLWVWGFVKEISTVGPEAGHD